jgi:PTH1 family peptidyl-tRNA hydrolase
MTESTSLLIVGLGNPGIEYEKTRHNVGALVVFYYAQRHGVVFKPMKQVNGYVGHGVIEGRKVLFLLPTTYMNLSGNAVRKCLDYYEIRVDHLLVLSDETYLPFGEVGLKKGGSAKGHNGLKSIEEALGTQDFLRLRIGIGEKTTEDLADYVLQHFSQGEFLKMDEIVEKCSVEIQHKVLSQHKEKQNEDLGRN